MPSSSERTALLGGPTPPRHVGTPCGHCRFVIVPATVTGVWVHLGTGERFCATGDTRATPGQEDDDA